MIAVSERPEIEEIKDIKRLSLRFLTALALLVLFSGFLFIA